MDIIRRLVFVLVLFAMLAAACAPQPQAITQGTSTVQASLAPTTAPTVTTAPSATPLPTHTPTPAPTDTPAPTATATLPPLVSAGSLEHLSVQAEIGYGEAPFANSSLSVSPDGQRLFAITRAGIFTFDAGDLHLLSFLPVLTGDMYATAVVGISPDGSLAAGSLWGIVELWDMATSQRRWQVQLPPTGFGSEGGPYKIAFSPNLKLVAVLNTNGEIFVLHTNDGSLEIQLSGYISVTGSPAGFGFDAEGRHLYYVVNDLNFDAQSVGFNTSTWKIDNRTALQSTSFSKVLIPTVLRKGSFYHEAFFVSYGVVTTRDYTNLGNGYEYKSDPFTALALSPDAQYLLIGNYLTSGVDVWQVGKPTAPLFTFAGHQGPIWGLAAAPDGQTFYSAGVDGSLRKWQAGQDKPVAEVAGFYPPLTDIAFNPQDGSLLAASTAGTVFTFHGAQLSGSFGAPQNKAEWKNAYPAVYSAYDGYYKCLLGLNSSGSQLLEGCSTFEFLPRLWQDAGREPATPFSNPVAKLDKYKGWINLTALSPDGSRAALTYRSADNDNDIRIYDTANGALLTKLKMKKQVDALEFSPDGHWLAAGGYQLPVTLFDVQSGAKIAELPLDQPNQQGVSHIRFSPDGLYLATVEYGYALLYDTTTWQIKAAMDPQGGSQDYQAITFLPGQHTLVVSANAEASGMTQLNTAHDGLYFWEYASGSTAQSFELPSAHGVRDLEVSPDGQSLALLLFDGRILLLGMK